VLRARSPFDALAVLACSGQALAPLVKARGFGMTQLSVQAKTGFQWAGQASLRTWVPHVSLLLRDMGGPEA
jgi:hypothetical protein